MNEADLSAAVASRIADSGLRPAVEVLTASQPDRPFYLYGGAVRDTVIGRRRPGTFDLDVLVELPDLSPLAAVLAGRGSVRRGPFGNLLWRPPDAEHGVIDLQSIAKIDNSLWPCEDLRDVLRGVDLTAHAIAYDLRDGSIHDPQNGVRDLLRGIARAVRFDHREIQVGDLELPFRAVTWFRILHYAAELELEVEPLTAAWLVEHRRYRKWRQAFARHFFLPRLDLLRRLG